MICAFRICIALYLGLSCIAGDCMACDDQHRSSVGDSLEQRIAKLGEIDRSEYLDLYQESIETGSSCVRPLIKALQSGNAQARRRAVEILGGLAPESKTVVNDLVTTLRDPSAEVRQEAARVIGNIGPEAKSAAQALVRATSDSDPRVRARAVIALGSLGVETDLAKPALIKALEDDGSFPIGIHTVMVVREEAAWALTKLHDDPGEIAAILIKAMDHDKPMSCLVAGNALSSLGPEAMPQVLQGLRSNRPPVRAAAAWALTMLHSPQAIPALEKTLQDKYGEIRAFASIALGQLGPLAVAAVPALIKRLDDMGPYNQQVFHHTQWGGTSVSPNAAEALGRIGTLAKAAIPALTALARDQNVDAARALLQIDPSNKHAFSILHNIVKADDEFYGNEAAEALSELGPMAKAAIPALRDQLKSPYDYNRAAAAYALALIDPKNEELMAVLIQDLKNELVPWATCDACQRIGPAAQQAVPALIDLLREDDWGAISALASIGRPAVSALIAELKHEKMSVRENAAECLGEIGADAEAAVPLLVVAVSDERLSIRTTAAQALGRIGAAHQQVVPALVKLLDDDYVAARRAAADSLGAFGQRARPAVDPLNAALNDDYKTVSLSAAAAIKKIGMKK